MASAPPKHVLTALVLLILPILFPHGTLAAGGRIELNQASIEAAGGFPVVVDQPGSYVLTGPLQVPADTNGFVLQASDVVFDLNGFMIQGTHGCSSGGCALGAGRGFSPGPSVAFARRITIRNGSVQRFGGDCVALNSGALVSDLVVRECGGAGIGVASGSLVSRNRVQQTGQEGLRLSGSSLPSLFAENVVSSAGLGGGGEPTVSGGRQSGGNFCDDGACSPRGQRRFYLTSDTVVGGEAAAACEPGFRVAALWEMWDPSHLDYDDMRGLDITDGVFPDSRVGWAFDGVNDCFDYTSTSGLGIVLQLLGPSVPEQPWRNLGTRACDQQSRVWCIEP